MIVGEDEVEEALDEGLGGDGGEEQVQVGGRHYHLRYRRLKIIILKNIQKFELVVSLMK